MPLIVEQKNSERWSESLSVQAYFDPLFPDKAGGTPGILVTSREVIGELINNAQVVLSAEDARRVARELNRLADEMVERGLADG